MESCSIKRGFSIDCVPCHEIEAYERRTVLPTIIWGVDEDAGYIADRIADAEGLRGWSAPIVGRARRGAT